MEDIRDGKMRSEATRMAERLGEEMKSELSREMNRERGWRREQRDARRVGEFDGRSVRVGRWKRKIMRLTRRIEGLARRKRRGKNVEGVGANNARWCQVDHRGMIQSRLKMRISRAVKTNVRR